MTVFSGKEFRVRRAMRDIKRDLRKNEDHREATARLLKQGFFKRFETVGATPMQASCDMQDSGPPPLARNDFDPCKTCGALVFSVPDNAVEIRIYDVAMHIAREGLHLPDHENMMHTVRYDFYCKRDRPAYDRQDIYPALVEDGTASFEFYVWRDRGNEDRVLRQVTQDGQQYDC